MRKRHSDYLVIITGVTQTMAEGSPDWIKLGSRAVIKDKGIEGTVRFIGGTEFAPGLWVGVELDESKGKNNGTVKGKVHI